jgi:hypothetical protein
LWRVGTNYKTGFGLDDWMIGFIAPYTFTQVGTTDNTAVSLIHTFYSSLLHALGSKPSLVVSWQRTYQSLTVTSNHSITPFLPLFCSCEFRRIGWIQFPCYRADILAGWRPETRLFTSDYWLLFCSRSRFLTVSFYYPSTQAIQKTHPILLRRRVYWSVI